MSNKGPEKSKQQLALERIFNTEDGGVLKEILLGTLMDWVGHPSGRTTHETMYVREGQRIHAQALLALGGVVEPYKNHHLLEVHPEQFVMGNLLVEKERTKNV